MTATAAPSRQRPEVRQLEAALRKLLPEDASLYVEVGKRMNNAGEILPLFRAGIDYCRAAGVHEGETADEVIELVKVRIG